MARPGDRSPKERRRIFQVVESTVRTRFEQFVLDAATRQLTRDGQAVHLSPKAFAVLTILLARRPNVVQKADLFGEIWPDVFVVDANLNVLVGEIRRALGDDAQAPRFIRTVHRVGYAFCGPATDARPTTAPPEDGAGRVWLAWKDRTFPLSEGNNVIGRDPRCDVWLDHASVSRRHARIRVPGGPDAPVLIDLQSTNGTFVGGRRIADATPLADGDTIKVGSVTVKYREWTDAVPRTRRIGHAARTPDRDGSE
jgi:DNA-binding winged helix-turn-helix (wHTH) protein